MASAVSCRPVEGPSRRRRLAGPAVLVASLSVLGASCSGNGSAAPGASGSRQRAQGGSATKPVSKPASSRGRQAASGHKTVSAVKGAVPSATPKQRQLCEALASGLKGYDASATKRTPSGLRAAFRQLEVEEPKVLAAAPGRVRGAFQEFFGYLNHFYAELSAVGFDYSKLSVAQASSLSRASTRITGATATMQRYLAATCRVSTTTISGAGSAGGSTSSKA